MSNVGILVTGYPIRIDNLENILYNFDGFIIEFRFKLPSGKKYIYLNGSINYDVGDNHFFGYVLESDLLGYYSGDKKISDISKSILKKEDVEFAKENDLISIPKLHFIPDDNTFYWIENISFNYRQNMKLLDINNNIIIPSTNVTSEILNLSSNQSQTALNFFTNKFNILNYFTNVEEKKKAHYLLTLIGLEINHIVENIFSKFDQTLDSDIYSYILKQKQVWESEDLFGLPSIKKLQNYYDNIVKYYEYGYKSINKVKKSQLNEKLYCFAFCLDAKALTIMDYEQKLELLIYAHKKKLSIFFEEEDENLVLTICSSFDLTNQAQIDLFLDKLISIKPYPDFNFTLYQCLYSKMSTSTKMKEGVISLVNHLVNTEFKPTTTKANFVNNIYALWMLSKYNPFDINGHYKTNTIGLKSQYNNLSQIDTNVDCSNYLFKYSNYYASDPVFEYGQNNGVNYQILKGYSETRPDAAPIVLPFINKKLSTALGEKYLVLDPYVTNFELSFSGELIKVEQKCSQWGRYDNISTPDPNDYSYSTNLLGGIINVPYGTYTIFQPVTLVNFDFESRHYYSFSTGEDITINANKINTLIPMFVLKFIQDDTDSSNSEDIIGFAVDVVTTATGFGSVQKLKHLKWAATGVAGATEIGLFSINGIRIFIGGVEFTSGVLSFLGNFVQCNTNDTICNGVKGFLNYLQLVCLAFNTVDGLASTMAKFKAKKLIDSANEIGSPNNTSVENLTQALGGSPQANAAAITILEFADEASQANRIEFIANEVKKLLKEKIVLNGNKFDFLHYTENDIKEIVTHLATKTNDVYIESKFNKRCRDFLFVGSRNKKLVSKTDMIKRINFFFDEVNFRGFPSGFNNLNNFKNFCTQTRNFFSTRFKFWDNELLEDVMNGDFKNNIDMQDFIESKWMNNFNFSERFELVVQGSSNTKYFPNDPLFYMQSVNLPDGFAGDFEFALRVKDKDFSVLGHIFKRKAKGFDKLYFDNKGFLMLDFENGVSLRKILGDKFVNDYKNSVDNLTNFNKKQIKFAIVLENGPYDLEPFTTFKYNN